MDVVRDLHWIPELPDGSAVTVGEFDGIHRGHRVVLSAVAHRAAVLGCPTVVVSFDRDPILLSAPTNAPRQLTDLDHKLELLATAGVDLTVLIAAEYVAHAPGTDRPPTDGDAAVGRLIEEVLVERLKARAVIVGEDFNFGERRRTSIEMFRERGGTAGFEVIEVPVSDCLTSSGDVISSMSIRRALADGDIHQANAMLGRPHELRSTVSIGDRRGRTIGFPTANLPVPLHTQLPADGVYAGWFWGEDGGRFPAAVNVGKRPTFYANSETSLVEAHLLGFRGDLYGQAARLTFIHHLRDERKFSGADELIAQLRRDADSAASLLAI